MAGIIEETSTKKGILLRKKTIKKYNVNIEKILLLSTHVSWNDDKKIEKINSAFENIICICKDIEDSDKKELDFIQKTISDTVILIKIKNNKEEIEESDFIGDIFAIKKGVNPEKNFQLLVDVFGNDCVGPRGTGTDRKIFIDGEQITFQESLRMQSFFQKRTDRLFGKIEKNPGLLLKIIKENLATLKSYGINPFVSESEAREILGRSISKYFKEEQFGKDYTEKFAEATTLTKNKLQKLKNVLKEVALKTIPEEFGDGDLEKAAEAIFRADALRTLPLLTQTALQPTAELMAEFEGKIVLEVYSKTNEAPKRSDNTEIRFEDDVITFTRTTDVRLNGEKDSYGKTEVTIQLQDGEVKKVNGQVQVENRKYKF